MKKNYKLTDDDFKRMKKVHRVENKYTDTSKHFYFSYTLRVALMLVVVALFLGLSYWCFSISFAESLIKEVSTNEKSSYTYEVIPFEDTEVAGNYSSSEVDKIKAVLSYNFEATEKVDAFSKYDVNAVMVIEDLSAGKTISRNVYELVKNTTIHTEGKDTILINPSLVIDYAKYNEIARGVIEQYNLNAKATLYVELNVVNVVDFPSFRKDISPSQSIVLSMPLLSNMVNVKLEDKLDLSQNYSERVKPKIVHTYILYLGIALLIVGTVILLLTVNFVLSVRPKKSKYCRLRDGILRDYDRIIVNVKRVPELKDYNIIDCYSFNELLDAQNLLEKPIIYFEIVRNQKCMFAIIGEQDIYKFVLKECDIDFEN